MRSQKRAYLSVFKIIPGVYIRHVYLSIRHAAVFCLIWYDTRDIEVRVPIRTLCMKIISTYRNKQIKINSNFL